MSTKENTQQTAPRTRRYTVIGEHENVYSFRDGEMTINAGDVCIVRPGAPYDALSERQRKGLVAITSRSLEPCAKPNILTIPEEGQGTGLASFSFLLLCCAAFPLKPPNGRGRPWTSLTS
jgi:hypothetical protein